MSPRKFEEIVNDLAEAGLDEDYIAELRGSWEASPLRRERDELKTQAQAALDRAKRYESLVAANRFRDLGIKMKPEALRTPDDLDWADEDKVRSWATDMGLIEPPPPPGDDISAEEIEAHQRIEQSRSGASPSSGVITPDTAAGWDAKEWARFEKSYPHHAEALARGESVKGLTV